LILKRVLAQKTVFDYSQLSAKLTSHMARINPSLEAEALGGKAQVGHMEDVKLNAGHTMTAERRESVKHGDRALALIGDERIVLTEEDVCLPLHTMFLDFATLGH